MAAIGSFRRMSMPFILEPTCTYRPGYSSLSRPLLSLRFSTTTTTTTAARVATNLRDNNVKSTEKQVKREQASFLKTNAQNPSGNDTFLAAQGVTWRSLGVSDVLHHSLSTAGFDRPSLIQAACIPSILSGKDVVMAAETGSGKTHGYLVPIIDQLYESSEVHEDTPSKVRARSLGFALVLCPNAALCEQVARMANDLHAVHGNPLLRVMPLSGGQGWPLMQPHVLVATPAALLNSLFAFDRRNWRRAAFVRDAKYVVFDEADLLMCGSFHNQVVQLINMFRLEEKNLSKAMEQGLATSDGVDCKSWVEFKPDESCQESESLEVEVKDLVHDSNLEDDEIKDKDQHGDRRKEWLQSRKQYKRSKQYIFVAATLPKNGKKTPGAMLKRLFPNAIWVHGSFLHQHNPRLQQRWIKVTVDTQVDVLIKALEDCQVSKKLSSGSVAERTMIFTNTVNTAVAVSKILLKAGIKCMCYHRETPAEERSQNLKIFQEKGGILVCTDAAARGIDVPNVSHVIQAEFASSAIDFLHRIGRTGRAGQPGLVTSLYTEANEELVEAVRKAGSLGQSVDGAFSRKRSFRNKIKKHKFRVSRRDAVN